MVVLGRRIEGITNIEVNRRVTKERQYGRGNQTQAILSGNEEISGTLTLLQDELDAINRAVKLVNPNLDLTKVAFDAVINYENAEGQATTDVVVGMQVEEYNKALSQGDTHMQIELPFMATALRENV